MPASSDRLTTSYKDFKRHLTRVPGLNITLDTSRMNVPSRFIKDMAPAMDQAYAEMAELEAGAIANPDEGRMVGHYWLRNAQLAPEPELAQQITTTIDQIQKFANAVHTKQIAPQQATKFTDVLVIGIGGSALGPQLAADALGAKRDKLKLHFLDNTDPDGIRTTLAGLGRRLRSTMSLVVSKSGGTPETRNGMLEAKAAYEAQALSFALHAVAVTSHDSKLDQLAQQEGWLAGFPMWDWVGGRTSITSAVGLLPMALQGIKIAQFLDGAAGMDAVTRQTNTKRNPAAQLALMWHHATHGQGERDMVILPYKDRLVLMSKYLQQLVMESLGKQLDRQGNTVEQGISVFGNKGSTDQHAYVQQLRDGLDNFFVTFITVLRDQVGSGKTTAINVEDMVTTGDYLHGLWQGTREALTEKGRPNMTITLARLDAKTLGGLIALFERAVGFYASLVNINAYHQPGVEAGKKAAAAVLDRQRTLITHLQTNSGQSFKPEQLAEAINQPDEAESIFHLCESLAADRRYVRKQGGGYTAI